MPKVACEKCKGTGLRLPLCDASCPDCNGSGQVDKVYRKKRESLLPDDEDGALVQRLCDEDDLTEWETDFCVSVEKWVLAGKTLTDKQRQKIEEILDGP